MSILNGIGIAVFPLAEFLSGQLYQAGGAYGYYVVFGCSLGFTVIGLIYIVFIPETITKYIFFAISLQFSISIIDIRRKHIMDDKETKSLKSMCKKGNQSIIDGYKTLVKQRPHRSLLLFTLFLMIFVSFSHARSSALLYVEKKFNWTVTDYTNYQSFFIGLILVRTFITTPLYSYVLKMHDCMLTITGLIVSLGSQVVFGTATKGWMMYYGASITVLGGLDSTPIRSLVSKMVEPDEYGKVFTFTATASGITSLFTSTVYQEIYAATVETYPGAVFLVGAGFLVIALVINQ